MVTYKNGRKLIGRDDFFFFIIRKKKTEIIQGREGRGEVKEIRPDKMFTTWHFQ